VSALSSDWNWGGKRPGAVVNDVGDLGLAKGLLAMFRWDVGDAPNARLEVVEGV
jgi:hypothetical protein